MRFKNFFFIQISFSVFNQIWNNQRASIHDRIFMITLMWRSDTGCFFFTFSLTEVKWLYWSSEFCGFEVCHDVTWCLCRASEMFLLHRTHKPSENGKCCPRMWFIEGSGVFMRSCTGGLYVCMLLNTFTCFRRRLSLLICVERNRRQDSVPSVMWPFTQTGEKHKHRTTVDTCLIRHHLLKKTLLSYRLCLFCVCQDSGRSAKPSVCGRRSVHWSSSSP